jgi:hypothetical protein
MSDEHFKFEISHAPSKLLLCQPVKQLSEKLQRTIVIL